MTVVAGCTSSATPPWANPDNLGDLASSAPAPEPSWTGAGSYLISLFDAQHSLCRPTPGATAGWSIRDNALAARAFAYLPVPTPPTSPEITYGDAIVGRLQTLKACGCLDQPEHDGLTDHHHDPLVNKGAQVPLQPYTTCVRTARLVPTAASTCVAAGAACPGPDLDLRYDDHPEHGWVADSCQGGRCSVTAVAGWDEEALGHGDAEHLALQLLNRKNRGLDPTALWQNLLSKWDGHGLRDRPTMAEGRYATDKLALLKICARVLGQPLPAGVDTQLAAAQNAQGGFRTHYDLSGQFSLDQQGSALTTAYVVLAYRKPVADF